MRRHWYVAGLAITILVTVARPASAQFALPDTIRASAQRAAGVVQVLDALVDSSGTMTVRLEADELSFDRIRREIWPPDLNSPARRTTTRVGREIARAAVGASPSTLGVRTVVIIVRSTNPQEDPSRVRLSFSRRDLIPRGLLDPTGNATDI